MRTFAIILLLASLFAASCGEPPMPPSDEESKTVERKSGARGLRSVVEDLLIPIMYDIPSDATITKVTIDEDTVNGGEPHVEHGIMRPRYKNIAMKQ